VVDNVYADFLDYFWGGSTGKVCIAAINPEKGFREVLVEWPEKKDQIVKEVGGLTAAGYDVYFSPAVYQEDATRRSQETFKESRVHWVDYDGGAPDIAEWLQAKKAPAPSLIVQSSVEGRQHVYWRREEPGTLEEIEKVNRGLASVLGADLSGWDGPQLLRIAGTLNHGVDTRGNHKPWFNGSPVDVAVIYRASGEGTRQAYNADSFESIESAVAEQVANIQVGAIVPPLELFSRLQHSPRLLKLWGLTADEVSENSTGKRSSALTQAAYLVAEAGGTDTDIYSAIAHLDVRWGKYVGRHAEQREKIYRDLIYRARLRVGAKHEEAEYFQHIADASLGRVHSNNPNYKVYSLGEFLRQDFHEPMLIDGLAPLVGLGEISGQPGAGKTTGSLNMAFDIATGAEETLGYKLDGKPRKVVYFSLELAATAINRTIAPMAKAFPPDSPGAINLYKNLSIYPSGEPIYLDTDQGKKFFEEMLTEYQPDVIFTDSLSHLCAGSLNDDALARSLMQYIKRITMKHRVLMITVHHEKKRSDRFQGAGELGDNYGSQWINAALDFSLAIRNQGKTIVVDSYKTRYGELRESVSFVRDKYGRFILVDMEDEARGGLRDSFGSHLQESVRRIDDRKSGGDGSGDSSRNGIFGLGS
jgi:hypothetical protein